MESHPPPQFLRCLVFASIISLGVVSAVTILFVAGDRQHSLFPVSSPSLSSSGWSKYFSLRNQEKYSTLQETSAIDASIERRAKEQSNANDCSNLMVYLPDQFAFHGHGSQINTYLLAVTSATYLNRPLLLVEPPFEQSSYASGSQFGCPVDAFDEVHSESVEVNLKIKKDFVGGFSRLIDHPSWLTKNCKVPTICTTERGKVLSSSDQHAWQVLANRESEINCQDETGHVYNILAFSGSSVLKWFRAHEAEMSSPNPNHQWAINLGATPEEVNTFSELKMPHSIWDFVGALMVKAGILRLQPWITRDVEMLVNSYGIPDGDEYDAIHVRRGDKLDVESRSNVLKYWRSKGYTDGNLPVNYIPFEHYLRQWSSDECPVQKDGNKVILEHNVYVATDDPVVVKNEIAQLSIQGRISQAQDQHDEENLNVVLWDGCHRLTFYLNPSDMKEFHIGGIGERKQLEGDTCFARYSRNIASIADLMVLAKSRTFIGEYNSNWGNLVRTMRVRLLENDPMLRGSDESVEKTYTKDTRIAWGPTKTRPPGF
ncbi:predicted protein [Thalassiosira pseudonana CCMP1335]|uniref:O-fucosyltransferase family protein n=1 Tax=Thalassiosira pseudonana TaxID=35128 RepID=B8C4F4_THAPS|nr:predicted protein [Thalassiosira pseudonana CCMP1335]EED91713.1 predicted protein [Thalassiosira pseudonana CCMP1335]